MADLKKAGVLKGLSYEQLLQVNYLVEKGADVALIYFWFNLLRRHYHPNFTPFQVARQSVFYMHRDPTFADDIAQWYNSYIKAIRL